MAENTIPTKVGGFTLNFKNKFEIDTKGDTDPANTAAADFAPLAVGINNFTPSLNETTANDVYYDGEGYGSEDVTGKRLQLAYTGHRKEGDKAQDYIASHLLDLGDDLKTLARWTQADGSTIVGQVTISAIVTSGGAPGAKQTFSFNLSFNGKPVYTAAPSGDGTSGSSSTSGSASGDTSGH